MGEGKVAKVAYETWRILQKIEHMLVETKWNVQFSHLFFAFVEFFSFQQNS